MLALLGDGVSLSLRLTRYLRGYLFGQQDDRATIIVVRYWLEFFVETLLTTLITVGIITATRLANLYVVVLEARTSAVGPDLFYTYMKLGFTILGNLSAIVAYGLLSFWSIRKLARRLKIGGGKDEGEN